LIRRLFNIPLKVAIPCGKRKESHGDTEYSDREELVIKQSGEEANNAVIHEDNSSRKALDALSCRHEQENKTTRGRARACGHSQRA